MDKNVTRILIICINHDPVNENKYSSRLLCQRHFFPDECVTEKEGEKKNRVWK